MNSTHNELLGKAKELLGKYERLSAAFLMRKLKIDLELAVSIMERLGLPTYITAEEYALDRH